LRGAYVSARVLLLTLSEHGQTTEDQYGYFYESNDYENPLHFLAPLQYVLCKIFLVALCRNLSRFAGLNKTWEVLSTKVERGPGGRQTETFL